MKLRAPRPALVISIIALITALSATAYAATRITSSSQIKNGIVTSSDIKNHTIQARDLSKQTLKTIGGGGNGVTTSTTAAFESVRKSGPVNQPANQLVKVAELKIGPGAYIIQAKTTMAGLVTPPQLFGVGTEVQTGNCKLDAAGSVDEANAPIVINNRQTPGSMVMQMTRSLGGAESIITLTCASGASWAVSDTSIIAQRVASVTQAASTP